MSVCLIKIFSYLFEDLELVEMGVLNWIRSLFGCLGVLEGGDRFRTQVMETNVEEPRGFQSFLHAESIFRVDCHQPFHESLHAFAEVVRKALESLFDFGVQVVFIDSSEWEITTDTFVQTDSQGPDICFARVIRYSKFLLEDWFLNYGMFKTSKITFWQSLDSCKKAFRRRWSFSCYFPLWY